MTSKSYALKRKKQRKTERETTSLFRARGVLGDSLGTLRNSVLGEFAGQDEADTAMWVRKNC